MRAPAWAGQVARFGIVGGLAFVLDAGVLALLVRAGASPYAARVASIAVSIVFTWALHRRMTFRTPVPPSWREFIAYVAQSLAGAVVSYVVYSAVLWGGGPIWAAMVLGTGVASVFNFVRYRALLG